MAKILCLANQKGGVAKSTNALNISYMLSQKGKKVILIDFDSQGSSSLNLGIDISDSNTNTIDMLLSKFMGHTFDIKYEDVKPYIYRPVFETNERVGGKWERVNKEFGFDVIPSSLALAMVEMKMGLIGAVKNNGKIDPFCLTDVVRTFKDKYDYVIIDTAPSLSTLSINAMVCAVDGIIIPSNLDIMSFRGIGSFIDTAKDCVEITNKKNIKHRGILGVLLSLYSERRTVDNSLARYIIDFYPIPVFKTKIIDSSDAKKANASMLLFSQINKKARACYERLVDEIEEALTDPAGWEESAKKQYEETKKEQGE